MAVVLVGNDPGSEIYVRNKVKACADLGILSEKLTPPSTISTGELLGVIEALNRRSDIDGILVQMPLPPQVDSRRVLEAVSAEKDADGFHPTNVGHLVANRPAPRACTPAGIMEMLRRYEIPIAGRHAVIVGRSDIVGKPMALLLLHANATVTICHSKTADLPGECRRADILVAAMGRAAFVTRDFIAPGAVVIDVGMNRVTGRDEVERIWRGDPGKLAWIRRRAVVDVHHPARADRDPERPQWRVHDVVTDGDEPFALRTRKQVRASLVDQWCERVHFTASFTFFIASATRDRAASSLQPSVSATSA